MSEASAGISTVGRVRQSGTYVSADPYTYKCTLVPRTAHGTVYLISSMRATVTGGLPPVTDGVTSVLTLVTT